EPHQCAHCRFQRPGRSGAAWADRRRSAEGARRARSHAQEHRERPEGARRFSGGSAAGGGAAWLAAMSPRAPSALDDPSVLVVEDKESLRTMLRHTLEAQGHRVIEARDHAEAIAALSSADPAIVVTDLRLPDGDGLGVLRAAKEKDPELPVLIL